MSEETQNSKTKNPSYIFNVSSYIHNKVEHLIYMLKKLTKSNDLNRQTWILTAIKEKIQNTDPIQNMRSIKDTKFHVKLDKSISDILEKEVENAKKFRQSFSKKLWILEAIHEKIERDEIKLKELLEKKNNE